MKRSVLHLRGRAVPLDADRTIVPVFELIVEWAGGKKKWWVNVALSPVHILLRTNTLGKDGEYREERIRVM